MSTSLLDDFSNLDGLLSLTVAEQLQFLLKEEEKLLWANQPEQGTLE